MKLPDPTRSVPAAILAMAAGATDLALDRDPATAILIPLVVASGAALTWWITRRDDLMLLAAATLAPWRLLYDAEPLTLLAALVLAATAAASGPGRIAPAAQAGAAAAAATWIVFGLQPAAIATATGLALALALPRPVQPTQDLLTTMQTAVLYTPAIALAGLLAVNAATRRWETLPPLETELFGLGVAGLLILTALALRGLILLLETTDDAQRHTWAAVAAAAGLAAGAIVAADAATALRMAAAAAAPLAALAAITSGRLRAVLRARHAWTAYLAAPVAVAIQLGFTP